MSEKPTGRIKLSHADMVRFNDARDTFAHAADTYQELRESGAVDAANALASVRENELLAQASEFGMNEQQAQQAVDWFRDRAGVETVDEAEQEGQRIADAQAAKGLISASERDAVARSHAEIIRSRQSTEELKASSMSPDEIRAKRAQMVQEGVRALDVGNMTDDEIAVYGLAEQRPDAQKELEEAQAGVDALNFRSDAIDHVRAKKRLQAAKEALRANDAAEQSTSGTDFSESEPVAQTPGGEPSTPRIEPLQNEPVDSTIEPLQNEPDTGDVEPLQNESDVEPLENEPAEEARRWYQRVKDVFGRAKEQLYDKPGRWFGSKLASVGAMSRKENETNEQYDERREKRGKAVVALGYGAVAAAAAFGVYKLISGIDDGSSVGSVNPYEVPGVDMGSIAGQPEAGVEIAMGQAEAAVAPETDPGSVVTTAESFSDEARTVEGGEGGWQTLQEMGVSPSDHDRVWEQIGNRLQEAGRGDLVYRMSDGRWGWTSPGALDQGTLDLIAEVINESK